MPFKILLSEKIHTRGMEILSEAGNLMLAPEPTEDTLISLISDADALVVRNSKVSAKIIEAGKKLKVIGRHGIGVDNIDLDACAKQGIIVVNTPEANVISVAEHVVASVLYLSKRLQQADQALRNGVFERTGSLPGLVTRLGFTNMELYGKSLGLVGMGRIARRVAATCIHGFGMKVYGYSRSISPQETAGLGVIHCASLEEVISDKDFVSINVPFTPETKDMIDAKMLNKMKPTAFLINTARGGVVNEKALFEALRKKTIAGASVDVYENEPPQKGHPFFELDNILVTPHMAAMTDGALYRMALDVSNDVVTVLKGKEPKHWFNRQALQR